MSILVIHNGPSIGAKNQSIGVARALNDDENIYLADITERKFSLIPIIILMAHLRIFTKVGPTGCFKFVWRTLFRGDLPTTEQIKYIITIECGRRTELACIALAQFNNAKPVIIRFPKYFQHDAFYKVISTEKKLDAKNIVNLNLAPDHIIHSDIDRALSIKSDKKLWSCLIGGSSVSYNFTKDDYVCLTNFLETLADKYKIKWLLATAPRTDEQGVYILKNFVANTDVVEDVIWWPDDNNDKFKSFLKSANVCFVTEESISMLSLCINAGRPVYAIQPDGIEGACPSAFYNKNNNDLKIAVFLKKQINDARIKRVKSNRPQDVNIKDDKKEFFCLVNENQRWENILKKQF